MVTFNRASFTTLPSLQMDQTLLSIATLLNVQNGLGYCGGGAHNLFGGPTQHRQFCISHGIYQMYQIFGQANASNFEEFLEKHSYLPLFRPFINPTVYERLILKIEQCKRRGAERLPPTDKIAVKPKLSRYCIHCAELSIANNGYAYSKRVHQIFGVDFCPEHNCILRVDSESHRWSFRKYGLIIPTEAGCWKSALNPVTPMCKRPRWKSLGAWVAAVFAGKIHSTNNQRIALLMDQRVYGRISPQEKHGPLDPNLANLFLTKAYGGDLVKALIPSLVAPKTCNLPSVIDIRSKEYRNPIVKLLILSALFDSPEEFISNESLRTNSE